MNLSFKETIKRILRQWGYEIRRYTGVNAPSVNLFEMAVRFGLSIRPNLFFLQIGANDGRMDDPVFLLVLRYRLSGLLVEPMPDAFRQLRQNYAGQDQLLFENCAVDVCNGQRTLYRVQSRIYEDERADGVAGFLRPALLQNRSVLPGLEKNLESITVKTMSMESLLEKHRVATVDILIVDTEGYDYEIVKLALSAGLRPSIVYYEHVHLSPVDQDACQRLLADYGYRFSNAGQNTLAIGPLISDCSGSRKE